MAYQSMQVKCFQESLRTGNPSCSIPLQDIVLDKRSLIKDLTPLITIIHYYKSDVKSLVHPSTEVETLTALRGLQSLDFSHVYMTHSDLERLYVVISQTTTLVQLKLETLYCSDHWDQYHDCDVVLDLHRLHELKYKYHVESCTLTQHAWRSSSSGHQWERR
jgi:hypothetical protein